MVFILDKGDVVAVEDSVCTAVVACVGETETGAVVDILDVGVLAGPAVEGRKKNIIHVFLI